MYSFHRDRPASSKGLALRPLLGLAGRFPLRGRDHAEDSLEFRGRSFGSNFLRQRNEASGLFGVVGLGRGLCHAQRIAQTIPCVAGWPDSIGRRVTTRYPGGA